MKNLYQTGNSSLLFRKKKAFLCSRQIPNNKIDPIYHWANRLSPETDCILCGNHSPMEQAVFRLLLEREIPTILVLAEGMPNEWNEKIKAALDKKHLLIITACNEQVHRVSCQSAYDRNNLILSLAEEIIIGYCTPNGNIDKQVAGRTNVTFLNRTIYAATGETVLATAAENKETTYKRLQDDGK